MLRGYAADVCRKYPLSLALMWEKARTDRSWTILELPLRYIWTLETQEEEQDSGEECSATDSVAEEAEIQSSEEEELLAGSEQPPNSMQLEEIRPGQEAPETHKPQSE